MDVMMVLNSRGTWGILIALFENEKMMIRQLMDEITVGQKAVYSALEGLTKIGLIKQEREPYHNRRWLMLTEKGKLVASKLKEITTILGQK